MENILICIESNMKVTGVCYQRSHACIDFQRKVLKVTKSYRKIIFTILYYIVIGIQEFIYRSPKSCYFQYYPLKPALGLRFKVTSPCYYDVTDVTISISCRFFAMLLGHQAKNLPIFRGSSRIVAIKYITLYSQCVIMQWFVLFNC